MRARLLGMAGIAAAIALAACATHAGGPAASGGAGRASWRYAVHVEDGGRELEVEAWLPAGSLAELVVRPEAAPYVLRPRVEEDGRWRDLARAGPEVRAPACARGCHLRYEFSLRSAADALRDTDVANSWGDVVEASPSVWLLHPALAAAGTRYRFHVTSPPGLAFVTGVFEARDGALDTYEADASDLAIAPYAAFGPMAVRRVEAATGAWLDVAIAPGGYRQTEAALTDWVQRTARAMARFLGCFPVERAMVLVVPTTGERIRRGNTMGDGGASIVVEVGEAAGDAELAGDWVLPHEMVHLAVPSVSRRYHWIEEGIAVYMQPIARARTGEISAEAVWSTFARGMPLAASPDDHEGLDGAPDWAKVYWGGATFCLLADVEIRRRTWNRLGFEDALRGVLASGGSVAHIWTFERLLDSADAWVGAPALRATHDAMGPKPWAADLPGLFRDLGVVVHDGEASLLDDAPLAAIRRAITAPLAVANGDPDGPVVCPSVAGARVAAR